MCFVPLNKNKSEILALDKDIRPLDSVPFGR